MKSFSPIFLLVFLLAGLGSKATPSVSPPAGSDSPLVIHPFQTSPHASENSTPPHPNPESPRTASPEPSPHKFTQTPNLDLQESPHLEYPETLKPTSLNTSISEPLETPKSKPSQRTHPEPSETPKPDPTEIPHPESPEIPKPNPAKTSHPEFPETLNPDPTQIPHQESQHVSKLNSTEISHAEALETPSPETHDPNTETQNSEFLQTFHPDPTQTPDPESHVTHNAHLTEIPHTELPIFHYQDATEIPTASDSEISISLHPKTPASFKDQATALNGLPLNTEPETLVTTQPDSLKLPTSDSLGTIEPEASQNSNPKGPDTPPPSARIAGSPAPPGPLNQSDPATARHPPRRSRGERVNTIIVVERLEETGVTLVGRPEGAAGGALCLFFAGTGLLLGVFLLLWCLYRRATRHRPFAHHRLPNDGDEPVMHVDAPKEPYDLYLYAPDAWIPSHIATKQPLPTPPLPPKLPPPPRGGRPQRLELLSPSSLPNNFV